MSLSSHSPGNKQATRVRHCSPQALNHSPNSCPSLTQLTLSHVRLIPTADFRHVLTVFYGKFMVCKKQYLTLQSMARTNHKFPLYTSEISCTQGSLLLLPPEPFPTPRQPHPPHTSPAHPSPEACSAAETNNHKTGNTV